MNRRAVTTLIALAALSCGLLSGCRRDTTPTIDPDGRVSAPISLPR
jgi:type IV pilus biogenesis protein CpaD/CtpE